MQRSEPLQLCVPEQLSECVVQLSPPQSAIGLTDCASEVPPAIRTPPATAAFVSLITKSRRVVSPLESSKDSPSQLILILKLQGKTGPRARRYSQYSLKWANQPVWTAKLIISGVTSIGLRAAMCSGAATEVACRGRSTLMAACAYVTLSAAVGSPLPATANILRGTGMSGASVYGGAHVCIAYIRYRTRV